MNVQIDETTKLPVLPPMYFWRVTTMPSRVNTGVSADEDRYYSRYSDRNWGVVKPYYEEPRVELMRKHAEKIENKVTTNWFTRTSKVTRVVTKSTYETLAGFMGLYEYKPLKKNDDRSPYLKEGWDLVDGDLGVTRPLPMTAESISYTATKMIGYLMQANHEEALQEAREVQKRKDLQAIQPLLGDYPPKAL